MCLQPITVLTNKYRNQIFRRIRNVINIVSIIHTKQVQGVSGTKLYVVQALGTKIDQNKVNKCQVIHA